MKRRTLFIALILNTLFFSGVVFLFYYQNYQTILDDNVKNTAQESLHQLSYTSREYHNVHDQITSVSNLLAHNKSLDDYLQNPTSNNKTIVEEVWLSTAVNQKWYTQIRFLDPKGLEKIRVNYNIHSGIAKEADHLQDKSDRDYFIYARTLKNETIGLWGFDLENEDGQLVQPYIPSVRVIKPIIRNHINRGYLVLNIDIRYLTQRLNDTTSNSLNLEVIDNEGFYISTEQENKLYGHILPQRSQHNLSNELPEVWRHLQKTDVGYFYDGRQLLAYKKIQATSNNALYFLIRLNESQLVARADQNLQELKRESLLALSLILFFMLPITPFILQLRQYQMDSRLAQAALDGMSAVMITDSSHRIMLVNQEFQNMLGHQVNQVQNLNAQQLLFLSDDLEKIMHIWSRLGKNNFWEGEVRCRTSQGLIVTAIMRIQAIRKTSDKISYYITSLVDISGRKKLEEQLRNLSERDGLTGLWNRRKFEDQLLQQTNLIRRYPDLPSMCLAVLDIDNFKRVNDELGHDQGDDVIRRVAGLLDDGVRNTDFVARVGGEEFAIIMPHTSITEAGLVLNRLRTSIQDHPEVGVTISIGYSNLSAEPSRSYKCADIALYDSKSLGRNKVSFCDSEDDIA